MLGLNHSSRFDAHGAYLAKKNWRYILEILAWLIVIVEKYPVLLNKDLNACLGAIEIQEYSCEFLVFGCQGQ